MFQTMYENLPTPYCERIRVSFVLEQKRRKKSVALIIHLPLRPTECRLLTTVLMRWRCRAALGAF